VNRFNDDLASFNSIKFFTKILTAIVFIGHLAGCSGEQKPSPIKVSELVKKSEEEDKTLWKDELQAQKHEDVFITFWDDIRQSQDKFQVFKKAKFKKILFGKNLEPREYGLQIRVTDFAKPNNDHLIEYDVTNFHKLLDSVKEGHFDIVQSEWHHKAFIPPQDDQPARSLFSTEIHLSNGKKNHRMVIRGKFAVRWIAQREDSTRPELDTIQFEELRVVEYFGKPVFNHKTKVQIESKLSGEPVLLSPIHVYDLNGDQLPEIILGGGNMVLWNKGDFKFENDDLFKAPFIINNSGVVADFTGDGNVDYLGVNNYNEGVLFKGDNNGKFSHEPMRCWDYLAKNPSAISTGDVDGDGDLDVWFTQYKAPYVGGQMPKPYYDANDGHPSFLFLNDGSGKFYDNTEKAGLAKKRYRRTYSSSFYDFDDDHDLDLVVVSDFAGLDIYQNDGKGHFKEITDKLVHDKHAFGMSHTYGDFNRDGQIDLYMVGMNSTTAYRLIQMNLGNPEFPEYNEKRKAMAYGNRLYQANKDQFLQTSLNNSVAQSGWSWGCSAFDFDNDDDDDLYVANGHLSGESAKDYCTQFWTHDLYTGDSQERPVIAQFLSDEFRPVQLRGLDKGQISWNGFEHNKLFMNQYGEDFLEIGFLMNVGFEFDSRGVVTADLDLDGKKDILVIENKRLLGEQGPLSNESLHILENQLETDNHWIGVLLESKKGRVSPIGSKITIKGSFGKRKKCIVTGDSYYAQHPSTAHFGLGTIKEVGSIEVEWPNGQLSHIENPEVNRYHTVGL